MREIVDVRVLEEWASQEYGSSLGQPPPSVTPTGDAQADLQAQAAFPPFVRQIILDAGDPRLTDLKVRLLRDKKKRPGIGNVVGVDRVYTAQELSCAELFQLIIIGEFIDACGEDFGTEYNDINACPICGAGRLQRSAFRFDLNLLPPTIDFARTLALSEWIISQRLADLMESHRITGYHIQTIEHKGKSRPKATWYQLIVKGSAGHTVDPTRFGIDFFTDDPEGRYTCPEHLLSGLHVLSEVFVSQRNLGNVDLALTINRTGIRSGVLMPTPLLLISPRFYQLLAQHGIAGYKVEVAHIVD